MILNDEKFIAMIDDVILKVRDLPNELRREYAADGYVIIEPSPKNPFRTFSMKNWMLDSFLAIKGQTVYVPLISARHPGRGALGNLFGSIRRQGYDIAIVVPLGPLEKILKKWGYTERRELICGQVLAVWRNGAYGEA